MCRCPPRRADGRLLVASHHGLNTFDPADGTLRRVASPEADLPLNRSNDGTTDANGRFWYGTMSNNIAADGSYFDLGRSTGSLWRVDSDFSVTKFDSGVGISNASAFSPDWSVFYFADTARDTIFAWDFDLAAGTLANKRVFSDLAGYGHPDGACIDAEGFLWNARWEGGCVIRFAPNGRVDRIVDVPARRVTCCAFGSAELDTLFITTSRLHLDATALAEQPDAGGIFAIKPGVCGCTRPQFGEQLET